MNVLEEKFLFRFLRNGTKLVPWLNWMSYYQRQFLHSGQVWVIPTDCSKPPTDSKLWNSLQSRRCECCLNLWPDSQWSRENLPGLNLEGRKNEIGSERTLNRHWSQWGYWCADQFVEQSDSILLLSSRPIVCRLCKSGWKPGCRFGSRNWILSGATCCILNNFFFENNHFQIIK